MKKFKVTYMTDKFECVEVRAVSFEMVNSDESVRFIGEEDDCIAHYNKVVCVVHVK